MNKKNLSVVLAGAMLATTVAPVLAETTASKEYTNEELALVRNEIKAKMETKKISTYASVKALAGTDVSNLMTANKSAFGFKVVGKDGKDIDLSTLNGGSKTNLTTTTDSKVTNNVTYDTTEIANILSDTNKDKLVDCTIQVVERKTTNFKGQIVPGNEITKVADSEANYEPRADFISGDASPKLADDKGIGKEVADVVKANNVFVNKVEGVGKTYDLVTEKEDAAFKAGNYYKEVKLTTNVLNNVADASEGTVEIYLDSTKKKVDFSLPLNDKGELLDCTKTADLNSFAGFEAAGEWKESKLIDEAPENVTSYKINAVESNENLYKVEDLYDGIALTAKGTELATDLENAKDNASAANKALVKISAKPTVAAGINKFSIYYYKNETEAAKDSATIDGIEDGQSAKVAYKSITIYSSDLKEIQALYELLNPAVTTKTYKVGIVAGDNRYATAVNVAKAQKVTSFAANGTANIVLVNGESLVDGLSAAPLAANLKNGAVAAPVLLSKADKLPEETKDYIKDELLKLKTTKAQKKEVVVSLVGGNSVLSESLVAELEDMGLTVKRYGGANREATSLKVAEELKASNAAFVVGGNGEADAMAISAVAASAIHGKDNDKVAPIIVSSVHGLSNKALTYVNENLAKGDITIVGGTSVVSEEDEKALNDSLSLNKASRIAGDNRFETNAAIIKKYYTKTGANVNGIVLAKDGVAKKSELVDALAAANYAAANNAPIVLATSSLNASQKNELLKVNKASTFATQAKLVQVGQGVERSVLKEVAKLFGLSNF